MTDDTFQRHFPNSDALCAYVRERTGPTVLLSFSRGKDSIASYIQLRRHGFTDIRFFYFQAGPVLRFVEESLAFYEGLFGAPILRVMHPSTQRMLKDAVFQPAERLWICDAVGAHRKLTPERVEDWIRERLGVPAETFSAVGNRAADTPVRRASINKSGPLTPARRSFLPVYDWTRARVLDEIEASGIPLPVDYQMFGRSWDGLQYAFIEPIRRRFPDDYKKLLQWFPYADADKARRAFAAREAAR